MITDAIVTDSIDADGVPGDAVKSFPANAEVLYASAKLLNAPNNTQVRVVWTYVTGNQIITQVIVDSGDIADRYINSSLEPTAILPDGNYKVEFFVEDRESRMRPLCSR
jgi:hypothetical protein